MPPDILEQIIARKRREVDESRRRRSLEDFVSTLRDLPPPADFKRALFAPGVAVIAEIKKRSPSKGEIRPGLDPVDVALSYESGGAAAISVLTDGPGFGGCVGDLSAVKGAVKLPVLRKDFVIDAYQVYESRAAGADAVLLIVAALSAGDLRDLIEVIDSLEMVALVEVHDRIELERALDAGAEIIGVNNRDLRDFSVSISTSLDLAEVIPPEVVSVAESGISTRKEVETLGDAGYDAILVGESLLLDGDPGEKLSRLTGVGVG